MKLTQTEYLTNRGIFCPVCGENSVEKEKLELDGPDIVTQDCSCIECGSQWTNYYELAGFDTLEIPQ